MIVRLLLDQVGGQRALGQQGIAGDVLSRDVTAFKQWDRHPYFVGAFEIITARYG